MNNIVDILQKNFQELDFITQVIRYHNTIEIKSKEGIEYICKVRWENNKKVYTIETENSIKRCRIGRRNYKSKYYDEAIILEMFENHVLYNEVCLKAFKKGIENVKNNIYEFDLLEFLENDVVCRYKDDEEMKKCIKFMNLAGMKFATIYPLPEIVEKQYDYLKEKTIEKITLEQIKRLMQENKEIHIYGDENKIAENAENIEIFKEINYSYGHIVAKAYTYELKMNILPLAGEILVYDIAGINEITQCDVSEYKNVYEKEMRKQLFEAIDDFDDRIQIEEEKLENEQ